MEEICNNCEAFRTTPFSQNGECHRRSPDINGWPQVPPDESCLEFINTTGHVSTAERENDENTNVVKFLSMVESSLGDYFLSSDVYAMTRNTTFMEVVTLTLSSIPSPKKIGHLLSSLDGERHGIFEVINTGKTKQRATVWTIKKDTK